MGQPFSQKVGGYSLWRFIELAQFPATIGTIIPVTKNAYQKNKNSAYD
jgi:hypothetical protein